MDRRSKLRKLAAQFPNDRERLVDFILHSLDSLPSHNQVTDAEQTVYDTLRALAVSVLAPPPEDDEP